MNVLVYPLAERIVDPAPERGGDRLVVEDNVGEAIHIHLRNFRLELTIEDFRTFAENVARAERQLNQERRDGDR